MNYEHRTLSHHLIVMGCHMNVIRGMLPWNTAASYKDIRNPVKVDSREAFLFGGLCPAL